MPLGESMISTLKSNNSIKLDKSKRFRKTLGGYSKKKKTEYDFPEATPEVLNQIKQKMLVQRRKERCISILVIAIIIVALILTCQI